MLERRLKNWKLELPDDMLREFMKKFHYPTLKELYSAIGDGTLDINDIKTFILDADKEAVEEEEQTKAAAKTPWSNANEGNGDDLMIINAKGVKGIDYKMAKCCNPVFGDDVFGFVTRDSGIKIHRISCPNAARLIEMYPYRIQRVKWADSPSSGSFQATVRVISYMESYVVNEIMDIINNFKSSLRSFNVIENQKSGNYDITMKISVPSNTELDKVISQIRNLKSVQKVSRQ